MSHALNRALEEPAAVDGAPALEGKASSVLSGKADCAVTKLPPIRGLHIPQPPHRLGQETSFCNTHLSAPGEVANPDVATPASGLRDHAFKLIRVLDDQGAAVGPWNPHLQLAELKQALRHMMLTRVFDERMHRAQRQGKTSFYMQCRGEEAIACAQTMALRPDDMCFPTYRMQGILIARGYPLLDMMNQIYSNAQDPLKGHQLPVLYSSRAHGFFSLSGNVGTQYCQAVGWAMACAYRGLDNIAAAWIGDGSTAEGDFHNALTFASVYRAPVILNIVNNQWAISSFQGLAGVGSATFASRAIGYDLPGLRVDGNDFLAVYAATAWAAERARRNLGATVIELFTYRSGAHSTSDDPTRYRPAEEERKWPLGDPIERLKAHLVGCGVWSEEEHRALHEKLVEEVREIGKQADAVGTLGQSKPSVAEAFADVYKTDDWRLRRQRQKVGI
jgi:2-oxoisovalerate dehydrogenase E1 component alpha subunit